MKYVMVMILSLLCSCSMHAQSDPDRPDPPILHSVSIDIETGNIHIIWYPSPTPTLVDYYEVLQLEPSLGNNTTFVISGHIDVDDRIFVYTSELPHQMSVGFSVQAVNDMGGNNTRVSHWQTPDSTIFLESEFDSCAATIALAWNDYNN
jgi:hypothetical protein